MNEFVRLILTIALAGCAVTFAGSAAIWFMDEERRIRRGLKRVLKATPEPMIVARGQGRGAGFNFPGGQMAVTWDRGEWCLIYGIDEILGAELMVDGVVVGRIMRAEPRRAPDQVRTALEEVSLRLIFDDARWPDFNLALWTTAEETRRAPATAQAAIQEANRWLARIEALQRRARPSAGRTPAERELERFVEATRARKAAEGAPPEDEAAQAPAAEDEALFAEDLIDEAFRDEAEAADRGMQALSARAQDRVAPSPATAAAPGGESRGASARARPERAPWEEDDE